MYLLINKDNSINFGDNHPVDKRLNFEGVRLIEFPDKELHEVVGDVDPFEAYWDEATETVIRNPRFAESEQYAETLWRDKELKSVLSRLDQYERDSKINPEFRTSNLTERQYNELLRFRKKLCEYPTSENYKLKIRPILNT